MGALSDKVKAKYPQYQNVPDDQLESRILAKYPQYANIQPEQKTAGGFLGNVAKSGVNAFKDTAKGIINVFNPDWGKNTLTNTAKTMLGTYELLKPGESNLEAYPKAIGKFYDDRYGFSNVARGDLQGAAQKTYDTAYSDPVGTLLDASTVLAAGGAAAGAGSKALQAGKTSVALNSPAASLGRTSQNLWRASKAIDPIYQTAKYTGKGISKAGSALQGSADDASRYMLRKSIKASPSQARKFREATGQDLGSFMQQEGFYGGVGSISDNIDDVIKPIQDSYNAKVRTGQMVNSKVYSDALRQYADDIVKNDFSPEAQRVAESVRKSADLFDEKAMLSGGQIPIDVITDTKSSAFSKVPGGAMADPTTMHAGKIRGGVGIGVLDDLAQGSAAEGRQLQALRQLQEIASQQSELGKGSQVFNLFKPSAGGITAGGVLGLGAGVPFLGAALGAGTAIMANSPRVQGAVARGLHGIAQTPALFSRTPSLPRFYLPLFQTRGLRGQ